LSRAWRGSAHERTRDEHYEEGVQVDGEFIPCRVKIWAAGNIASFVGKTLSVPVDRVGRLL
jgi:NADH dehydrogenase FAD-containing subunit